MSIFFRWSKNIVLTIAISVLLVGCNQSNEKADVSKPAVVRPVKTIVAKQEFLELEHSYAAVVLPSQEADLSFRVSGRVIELPIANGMQVKKDDVIAQLDTRDFEAAVVQMETQVAQAQEKMVELKAGARAEDVAATEADVAAAQAQLDAAKDQVARTAELFKKKIVAKAALDKDRTSQRVAEAALEAKQQALNKSKAGARKEDIAAQDAIIKGLQSQLESKQANLADATLRAPFAGVIAARKIENFSNIQANSAVATLQNLKTLDMTFDVPAPDVAKLAIIKGLQLNVTLESIPGKVFAAKSREFSTQADAATQTYRGRVTIEDLNGEVVLPGMTGNIIITAGQEGAGVFMLPVAAVASSAEGKPFAWIISSPDNKASKRELVTGEATGGNIIISKGLMNGDIVAIAGISALQEGMVVKPISGIGE